jgi:hypothetical protein
MPEISLTTFVDFVNAAGSPKITVVRTAKRQYMDGYKQSFDFWKRLRDAIVRMHAEQLPRSSLDEFLADFVQEKQDVSKAARYKECIDGYKKWLGKKKIEWIGTIAETWDSGALQVRINPELGLRINGTDYLVKLYWKSVELPKLRAGTMLHLMKKAIVPPTGPRVSAILDVSRAKLMDSIPPVAGLDALLEAEAQAFVTIWNQI